MIQLIYILNMKNYIKKNIVLYYMSDFEFIEPDDLVYDESSERRTSILGDIGDIFYGSKKHPTITNEIEEYTQGDDIDQDLLNQLHKEYINSESTISKLTTRRRRDYTKIKEIEERPETPFNEIPTKPEHQILAKNHNPINKKKILELMIDSYNVYGESTIDNSDSDTQVNIIDKGGYLVVSFRGTEETHTQDIITDINTFSSKLSDYFNFIKDKDDLKVHSGFLKAVVSVYYAVKNQIQGRDFDGTGHSMGAAEVCLFSYIYYKETNIRPNNLITFGSPRFILDSLEYPASRFNDVLDCVRIMNINDIVSYLPSNDSTFSSGLKGAFKGAESGTSIGMYGGSQSAVLGAGIGSLIGSVSGMMAGGSFKHIGLGILLFPETNAVIEIDDEEQLLKDKNYYLIPEDVDILRNPVEINKTLRYELLNKSAWILGNSGISSYLKNNNPLAEISDTNILRKIKDVFNINFRNKLESKIVSEIAKQRLGNLKFSPFSEPAQTDSFGKLWSSPVNYLSGQILKDWEDDSNQLRNFKIDIRKRFRESQGEELRPLEQFGIMRTQEGEDLSLYNEIYKDVLEHAMNSQLEGDLAKSKELYGYIGTHLTSTLIIDAVSMNEKYKSYQGHLFSSYSHNINLLPDIIYEGTGEIKDTLGNKYYIGANNQGTYINKLENQILGFIFYKKEHSYKYDNKIIIY
tara:strand:- start:72 stop:2141 length:2070 start_codon:yes stop_codon:yes gene_type:complete